jgi:cardiolipin synthase
VTRRDIPNLITLLRFGLVVPVVVFLLRGDFVAALLCFALAGFSDALDGYLAKQYGWESRVGGVLDPLADKVLLVATYLSLGWLGLIPVGLVVLILGRDLLIVVGGWAYHLLIEPLQAHPRVLSKINTFAQIALALMVVAGQALRPLPEPLLGVLVFCVAATTALSGLDYVLVWGARAVRRWQEGRGG